MGWVIVAIAVIIVLILVGYLLNSLFVMLGFNLFYFFDNLLAMDTSLHVMIPWAIAGAIIGICYGLWRAGNKYRAGYLKPLALIIPALLIIMAFNNTKPMDYHSEHSVRTYYILEQEQKAKRRAATAEKKKRKENMRHVTAISGANIRAGASKRSQKIDVLPQGAKVHLISRDGKWAKVSYVSRNGRKVGYINESLLSKGR